MITTAQYTQAFINLLPQGWLFEPENGDVLYNLIFAICANYSIFDTYCDNFINEMYPDTALELLPEWEREYGLPDDCSLPDDTVQIRREILLAKYNALGGQSRAYFISLAAYLGFEITITEFGADLFRTNISHTNDVLYGEAWQWIWQINCQSVNDVFFRTNVSTTNEPLIIRGNQRLICFMEDKKPAHTELLFNFF